jgi:hypothetical protein
MLRPLRTAIGRGAQRDRRRAARGRAAERDVQVRFSN